MQESKISPWQFMTLLLLVRIMHSMIYQSSDFQGGTPILLALLCATLVEAVCAVPAVVYFQKGGQDPALEICGKRAWMIRLLYSLYFLVIAGGTVSLFAHFLESQFVETVFPLAAVIFLCVAAAYCAFLGIEGVARAGTVVFWMFVILFVSMAAVSEGSFDWLNMQPLGAGDGRRFMQYFLESLSSSWWLPMFCILGVHLRKKPIGVAYGYLFLKLLISAVLIILVTLVLWKYVSVVGYPILALGAYAKSGLIQRFNAINMLIWAINCTLVVAVYVFIMAKPSKKPRPAAALSALAAGGFAYFFYKNGLRFDDGWLMLFKTAGIVLLGIVIPAAALVKLMITRAKEGYIR